MRLRLTSDSRHPAGGKGKISNLIVLSVTTPAQLSAGHLGFGAMRITGEGISGPPRDESEAIALLLRRHHQPCRIRIERFGDQRLADARTIRVGGVAINVTPPVHHPPEPTGTTFGERKQRNRARNLLQQATDLRSEFV